MENINQVDVQFEAQPAENLVLPSEQENHSELLEEIDATQELEVSNLPEIPDEEVRPLFVVDGIPFGGKFVATSVVAIFLGLFGPWILAQGEIGSLYSQKEIGVANELSSREAQLRPLQEAIRNLSN
jgi:hypothetical protein